MKQYLDLVRTVLETGTWQQNRTGIRTIRIPGAMMRFDLKGGLFPAITTRKLAFKSSVGEMIGFLRGYQSAAQFRALGCRVWDQNANENAEWLNNPYRTGEDDLGVVYGVQWRRWPGYKLLPADQPKRLQDALSRGYREVSRLTEHGAEKILLHKSIDQIRNCLDAIVHHPTDRRILFHAWNPAQLDEMALPPCHLLYHFLPDVTTKEISLCLTVRSNDLGLGAGFNMSEGAALLYLVGRLTGYAPRWFTYFIGDAHIYENHLDMLNEQLKREPYSSPQLKISDRVPDFTQTGRYEPEWLEKVEPSDFWLLNYRHHPALTAAMAV